MRERVCLCRGCTRAAPLVDSCVLGSMICADAAHADKGDPTRRYTDGGGHHGGRVGQRCRCQEGYTGAVDTDMQ